MLVAVSSSDILDLLRWKILQFRYVDHESWYVKVKYHLNLKEAFVRYSILYQLKKPVEQAWFILTELKFSLPEEIEVIELFIHLQRCRTIVS